MTTSKRMPASRTSSGTKLERFRESADVTNFVSDGNGYRTTVLTLGGSPQDIQDVTTREKGSVGQDNGGATFCRVPGPDC